MGLVGKWCIVWLLPPSQATGYPIHNSCIWFCICLSGKTFSIQLDGGYYPWIRGDTRFGYCPWGNFGNLGIDGQLIVSKHKEVEV